MKFSFVGEWFLQAIEREFFFFSIRGPSGNGVSQFLCWIWKEKTEKRKKTEKKDKKRKKTEKTKNKEKTEQKQRKTDGDPFAKSRLETSNHKSYFRGHFSGYFGVDPKSHFLFTFGLLLILWGFGRFRGAAFLNLKTKHDRELLDKDLRVCYPLTRSCYGNSFVSEIFFGIFEEFCALQVPKKERLFKELLVNS